MASQPPKSTREPPVSIEKPPRKAPKPPKKSRPAVTAMTMAQKRKVGSGVRSARVGNAAPTAYATCKGSHIYFQASATQQKFWISGCVQVLEPRDGRKAAKDTVCLVRKARSSLKGMPRVYFKMNRLTNQ
jgi:hypothetical protein